MEVEILTYDADPNHGGFGARVDALIRMFAAFARVHVTLTDWFGGTASAVSNMRSGHCGTPP